MTYTLYGTRGSGSAAIEMGLRACGFDYRVVRAATWEPDSAIDKLTRVNPLRQIPTLVLPDGNVLTESAAILIHLGLTTPESLLLPPSPSSRAQAVRGLVFVATNLYSAVLVSDFPDRWTSDSTKPARANVREAARRQLYRAWDIFAECFAALPYLSGATPGALDMLTVVVSRWADARAHIAASRPAFLKVLALIESHAAIQPVVREHWES